MKRRFYIIITSLSIILIYLCCTYVAVYAVPADPTPVQFQQKTSGELITLRAQGDEFLHWIEDMDGNLVWFDNDDYYYAVWTEEGIQSTGILVSSSPVIRAFASTGSNIPQAVLDNAEAQREKYMTKVEQLIDFDFDLEPFNTPTVNTNLQRQLLVIHVKWSNNSSIGLQPLTDQQIASIFFTGSNSVNAYYKEAFSTTSDVIIPAKGGNVPAGGIINVTLSGSHTGVGANGDSAETRYNIMANALNAAVSQHNLNLKAFKTSYGSGDVLYSRELSIGFVIHGYESAVNRSSLGNRPAFWGCAFTNPGKIQGLNLESFFGQGAYHFYGSSGSFPMSIGTPAHEMGHAGYGFDDVYDYGTLDSSSYGMGDWSLMGSGNHSRASNSDISGTSPSYVDAYNLVEYKIVNPGRVTTTASGTFNMSNHLDIYKIETTDTTGKQYFLLQQRKNTGFDRGPFHRMGASSQTGGVLIKHIDENVNLRRINDKRTHYRAGILEAHGGTQHLQQYKAGTLGNLGDSGDLWGNGKNSFNSTTNPNSNLYSAFTNNTTPPTKTRASGVNISNISFNGARTTFTVAGSSASTYTVTYNANGGTNAPAAQSIQAGTPLTVSRTIPAILPPKTFLGWATGSTATSATHLPGASFTPSANTTLYAVWQNPKPLTINQSAAIDINFPGKVEYYSFTPSTNGTYALESTGSRDTRGILYTAAGDELLSNIRGGESQNFKLTYELTAGTTYIYGIMLRDPNASGSFQAVFKWVPEQRTITYNANGGSNAPDSQSADAGTRMSISIEIPTRTHYTFMGWAGGHTATNPEHLPGDSLTPAADMVLYAVWQEAAVLALDAPVTVDVNFAGKVVYYAFTPAESGDYAFNSTGNLAAHAVLFDRAGMELKTGFNSGDELNFKLTYFMTAGTTYYYGVELIGVPNVGTLSAVITPAKPFYTITYDNNGGIDGPSFDEIEAGIQGTISRRIPENFPKTFLGWVESRNITSEIYLPGADFTPTQNMTFYALWEDPKPVTDTYTVVNIDFGNKTAYFSYTPSASGNYGFDSRAGTSLDFEVHAYLYNSTGTLLDFNRVGKSTGAFVNDDLVNFNLIYSLTAGQTYYLGVKLSDITATTEGIGATGIYATQLTGKYVVKFHANDGSGLTRSRTVDISADAALNTLATPITDGFPKNFMGWALTADGEVYRNPSAGFPVGGNMDLYAVWKDAEPLTLNNQVTAQIIHNRQTCFSFTPIESGLYVFESLAGSYETTSGFIFNSNGSILAHDFFQDTGNGSMSNFRVLYHLNAGEVYYFGAGLYYANHYNRSYPVVLKSANDSYTVEYESNGGILQGTNQSLGPQIVQRGSALTLRRVEPTLERGMDNFTGWSTDKNGLEPIAWPAQPYTPAEDTTLYAVWQAPKRLTLNAVDTVNINFRGKRVFYTFIPLKSGDYILETDGAMSPMVSIFNSNGVLVAFVNLGGVGNNIKRSYTLESGETYYIRGAASTYERIGTFGLSLKSDDYENLVEAFITRVYQSVLGRDPDPEGLAFWMNDMGSGEATASTMIYGFLFSQEFIEQGSTDDQFISIAYHTFMGREPEDQALNFWRHTLNSGYTRRYVVDELLASPEFADICAGFGIAVGPVAGLEGFVARMYRVVLDRRIDTDGFDFWLTGLKSGHESGANMVYQFFNGWEFEARGLSDSDFIDVAYLTVMNREAEPVGKAHWLDTLQSGFNRLDVLGYMMDSTEFRDICANYNIKVGELTRESASLPDFLPVHEEVLPELDVMELDAGEDMEIIVEDAEVETKDTEEAEEEEKGEDETEDENVHFL